MTQEKWKQKMLDLVNLPGNDVCADCGHADSPPDFLSYSIGVFLCIKCAGIHRSLGTKFSKVKSIYLDKIDEETCKAMEEKGNLECRKIYEHCVPECWVNPTPNEHPDIIEQWIHAKYERKEFMEGALPREYRRGAKYGCLMKKKKSGSKWSGRFFVLSSKAKTMCYFINKEDSEPKQVMSLKDLNICMMPKEIGGKDHCMLISFRMLADKSSKQRHIFVCADNSFDIVDWYLAIRTSRFNIIRPHLEGIGTSVEIDSLLSRKFVKMGYLHKTGSSNGDGWRQRFVYLDINRFLYCSHPLDALPLNEVSIVKDESDKSYTNLQVDEGIHGVHPQPPFSYCFMVKTDFQKNGVKRVFNFCAESLEEMVEWIASFREAMKRIQWPDNIACDDRRASILSCISTFSSRSYLSSCSSSSLDVS